MAKNRSRYVAGATSKVIQRYIAPPADDTQVRLNGDLFSSNLYLIEDAHENVSSDLNKIETPILDALEHYLNNPTVALHIPGHTKGKAVHPKFKDLIGERAISLDTTDEFDNLGTLHPEYGPIERSQELTAQLFGATKSFFLLNGSTVGNLALALTVTKENEKVIISRNCHKSIISGLVLTGAIPVWAIHDRHEKWGVWGGVNPKEIERLLDENPDAKVVWITNPTYEGVVSDIESISEICKARKVKLLVDEAHGCLWKFNKKLPKPALECGADAVVHSMHKTAGSFSQSSVLHINKNSKINYSELEANLRMLHTTSPSYTLLASIDAARAVLSSKCGIKNIDKAINNANLIREKLKDINGVKCLSPDENVSIDPTKIYIMIEGLSGKRLESILEIEHNIEVESSTDNGILALSNIGNSKEELEYFAECIISIAKSNYSDITYLEKTKYMPFHTPETVCTPRKAFIGGKEQIAPTNKCIGRISAEVIAECPPGISILVPGEKIKAEHLPYLTRRNKIWVTKDT